MHTQIPVSSHGYNSVKGFFRITHISKGTEVSNIRYGTITRYSDGVVSVCGIGFCKSTWTLYRHVLQTTCKNRVNTEEIVKIEPIKMAIDFDDITYSRASCVPEICTSMAWDDFCNQVMQNQTVPLGTLYPRRRG
jgi:hypothetical protein